MAASVSVERITVGRWSANCYLAHDGQVGMIIDPGDEPEIISQQVTEVGFNPVAIINTHGHFDHVGAVAPLKRMFGIPFYLHCEDRRLLTHANLYRSLAGDRTLIETPTVDSFLEHGGKVDVHAWVMEVIHTPGHTAGSVCLRVANALFTGDTLFSDGVGRTDLPGGSKAKLADSLSTLAACSPEMEIFPGHGPGDTLGAALSRETTTSAHG
jgi:hydroxyacylglutathione hydrolase